MNTLYYGDDLNILRRWVAEALLRTYKGEKESDHYRTRPTHLHPEENKKD